MGEVRLAKPRMGNGGEIVENGITILAKITKISNGIGSSENLQNILNK